MHAKQASFGSEDFFVRMKGKHNCGFAVAGGNIQQDNNKHTSQMKRINNATAKSPVVIGETSRSDIISISIH
jgi:predicted transcriptional regulator